MAKVFFALIEKSCDARAFFSKCPVMRRVLSLSPSNIERAGARRE
jgi:hypothetical protein